MMIINLTSYTHGTMKLPNKADTNLSHHTWYSKSPRSAKQIVSLTCTTYPLVHVYSTQKPYKK